MNDEIKEILESSRKIINSNRENGFDRIIMLGDDIDKILDYITNLQQHYNDNVNKYEELIEKHSILQQENESWRRVATKKFNDAEDYKSRIDKAIGLIEPFIDWGECTINGKILKQIEDILKGDNNE